MDSQEKKPLEFPFEFVSEVERRHLNVGDYGCQFEDGYEVPVYFERKSIPDLFGTFTNGKKVKNFDRFKKEIARAKKANVVLHLIIEGTFTKVKKGITRSKRKGISIIRQANTVWLKYGLIPIYCKDRAEMAEYIYEYYRNIGEKRSKGIEVTL